MGKSTISMGHFQLFYHVMGHEPGTKKTDQDFPGEVVLPKSDVAWFFNAHVIQYT